MFFYKKIRPERVIQFGEGGFLRGFVDWMLQIMNEKTDFCGKIHFGSGGWFNDQRDGMVVQMTSLANLGMLSRFVGMLTDSRSFVSHPRHEYFRRILCNLIGTWVEDGEYPADIKTLEKIASSICYYNAKNYFIFKERKNVKII